MKPSKLSEKKWFNGAVIACIGVSFYFMLTHFDMILGWLGTFLGYFNPVIFGLIFAYILSPLVKFFYYRVFRAMKIGNLRWALSVVISVLLMVLAIILLLGMLIPQLLQSLVMLTENLDSYAETLTLWIKTSPLSSFIDTASLETTSGNAMTSITDFIRNNSGNIMDIAASSGKNIVSIVIGMILAFYLLIDRKRVIINIRKAFRLMLSEEAYEIFLDFTLRLDTILVNYIVHTLIDALIIGSANAVFMFLCKMPYIGLISVVVGVTNLVPNFGPIIGGVIGAFVLLLVNPTQALMFVGFTLLLQFADGYIIKPKLFSNSLGVSGLLILISTIVLGNMFGILGILMSIPTAAILSFVARDYFIPWKMKKKRSAGSVKEDYFFETENPHEDNGKITES